MERGGGWVWGEAGRPEGARLGDRGQGVGGLVGLNFPLVIPYTT